MDTISLVSRRAFLQSGSAIIVGFTLDAALPQWLAAQGFSPEADLGKPVDPRQVDSFLAFHTGGTVSLFTSKVDVGTGLRAATSQMAAEELGIPVERISVFDGDTALTPNQGGTGGSSGIPVGGIGIRQAAATARQAILKLAAEQLNRPANGVHHRRGRRAAHCRRAGDRPNHADWGQAPSIRRRHCAALRATPWWANPFRVQIFPANAAAGMSTCRISRFRECYMAA